MNFYLLESLACFLALAVVGGNCDTVSCYVCASVSGGGCGETGFQASSAQTVTGCNACSKTVASALGVTSVSRGCESTCTAGGGSVGGLAGGNVYCCTSSLCNGAGIVRSTISGIVGLLAAILATILYAC